MQRAYYRVWSDNSKKNNSIFVHDQSQAERLSSKQVKQVGGVSDYVNLPCYQGKESNKATIRKQR